MRAQRSLVTVVALLVVAACTAKKEGGPRDTAAPAFAPAPDDATTARAAIEALNGRLVADLERGDANAAASHYAKDAVFMGANDKAWRGRDAVQKGIVGMLSQLSFKDAKLTTDDVMVRGDLAVETGTYRWTLQPKSGTATKDEGKYLTVWQRDSAGTWKIIRDISNTDLPATK
jgi:uncharacterized protein (TIGR02246 family)